jgi:hypothetical protein
MRGCDVLPQLLGIGKLRSEDSVRRAFERHNEEALPSWMDRQKNETDAALLDQQWVLDLDATVKTRYGRQEEARVGYNPMHPGRPSHVYHAMVLTAARPALHVDAEAGNRIASTDSQPSLRGWTEARRVIALRRKLAGRPKTEPDPAPSVTVAINQREAVYTNELTPPKSSPTSPPPCRSSPSTSAHPAAHSA